MKRKNRLKNISKLPFRIDWSKSASPKRIVNRYKLIHGYLSRKPKVKGMPLLLHLEVTNRCNLHCKMCGRTVRDFGGATDMPFETYKDIIDQAADMEVEMVQLHSWGEPLLHPQIIEMIEYATEKGLQTWMNTNATLMDEKVSRKILHSGLGGLVFSVDGATAPTYESIRQGAHFEKTVANIKKFIELKKKSSSKVMLSIQMIQMPENQHEIDEFITMWQAYDINIVIKPLIDWYSDDSDPTRTEKFVCDKLWFWMKIQSSGKVIPCGHDAKGKNILGDVRDDKLKNIWNNSACISFRKRMCENWKDIDICRICKYQPPRRRNFINNLAFIGFDLFSLTKILFTIGYKKDV